MRWRIEISKPKIEGIDLMYARYVPLPSKLVTMSFRPHIELGGDLDIMIMFSHHNCLSEPKFLNLGHDRG